MTTPLFGTLCVIGPGLMGSSVLRRLRATPGLVDTLVVTDRDPDVLSRVHALDLGDIVTADAQEAVKDADCVMLCVPVGAMAPVATAILPHMKPGAILTDVGSTRRSVADAVSPHMRDDIAYVAAHPMAGTEHSGPDAGFATLFEGSWCLLTPDSKAPQDAIDRIAAFWDAMGARIRVMDIDQHDTICAMVSHLPHMIAFTICGTADTLAEEMRTEVLDFAASGFRDFTRVAASDPTMWRDIFLHNKDALLSVFDRFSQDMADMAAAIREGDEKTIVETISRGRRIRRGLADRGKA
ncbi:prephenate dehydrogenase/arogenate dehydrogenase family protein [Asaia astilbis]|uniref:prephenate dehydrogenase/arogenate dehydrogenase family protein n=1 Tax=Asaia astilbis TaxID=610244 RepID=UPI00046F80C1|nr:prephenate dehydrogenase/arogenate dehydrogenase family protein [Asaia astilbis]